MISLPKLFTKADRSNKFVKPHFVGIGVFWLSLISSSLLAQDGPGGVDSRDGAGGLVMWIVADSANVNGSNEVTSIPNLVNIPGLNMNALASGIRPSFIPNSLNGHAEVSFGNRVDALESATNLNAAWFPTNTGTVLYVLRHDNNSQRSSSYITGTSATAGSGNNRVGSHNPWNGQVFSDLGDCGCAIDNTNNDGRIVANYNAEWVGQYGIWISRHSPAEKTLYRDAIIQGPVATPTAYAAYNQHASNRFYLGHSSQDNFQGDLAEIIMFKTELNDAQLDILRNYFAAKYDLAIQNDYHLFQASHGVDVIGIGQTNGETHLEAKSAGILTIKGATSIDTNGDFVFAGHDNADALTWTTSEQINGDVNLERIAREWRFDASGNPGTITISLDVTELPSFNSGFGFYTLWVDNDGDFTSGAIQYPLTQNGSEFEAAGIPVADGMFVTIAAYRPVINFTQTAFGGFETISPATFEINVDYPVDAIISVDYTVSGTCTENLPAVGTFTIPAGSTTTALTQAITSGDAFEPDETIIITLTGGSQSAGALGSSNVSTYTVHDDGTNSANTVQFDAPFSYSHKKTITIDQNMVSGASDLVDFPVLVTISGAEFTEMSAQVQNASGFDIRFTYENAVSWLAHDIESYDIANGVFTAWVSIPVLSASQNTVIEMYYGNASVSMDPSTSSVWDEYHGVYMLGNNDVTDATSNGHDGTNNGTTDIAGIAGRSQFFNGTADIDLATSFPNLTTTFTISAWVFIPNISLGGRIFSDDVNNSGGYALTIGDPGNGLLRSFSRNLPGSGIINGTSPLSASSWQQVVLVVDRVNQDRIIYVNGASQVSDLSDVGTWGSDAGRAAIGGEGPGGENANFDGRIDHVTISSVVRSAAWVATEYNMINSPATYFTIGAEEANTGFQVSESTDILNFTISLAVVDAQDVSVNYSVTAGTASSGVDYAIAPGTATITAGNLSTVVTVDITDDAQDEGQETFTLSLSNPFSVSNVSLGSNYALEVTLIDNDNGPTIAVSDTLLNANEGASSNVWSVNLSAASGQTTTVDYTITAISATAGVDYILGDGTLTIPPGNLIAEVGFNVVDDDIIESPETFAIKLSNPVNVLLDVVYDSLTVSIVDNDNFGFDGPGGIGDADGSGTLVMWVIADSATVSGTDVIAWENEVGISALDLAPPLANPTWVPNAKNGHAEISFSNVNDVLSTTSRLSAAYFPYNEASTFIVTRHDNLTQESNTYGTSTTLGGGLEANRFSAHLPWNGSVYFDIGTCCGTDGRSQFVYNPEWVGEYTVFSYTASSSNGKTVRGNATQQDFDAGTDFFQNHTNYYFNLGQSQTNNFQGDILEYIMFTSPLNTAQVIIMENYLATKYNLTLDQNNYYSFKTTHSTELVGIGQEDANNFHNAAQSNFLTISNASDLDNGEYVMVGHDNLDVLTWSTSDVPSTITNIQRLEREFRVDVTGTPGTISISIDNTALPTLPVDYTEYLLLTDNDGLFASGATIYPVTLVNGEYIANNVVVTQGTYFTIATHRRTIEFNTASTQGFESANNTISLGLSVFSGSDISIPYTIAGSAANGSDFTIATSGSFVIRAGKAALVIDLGILDDSQVESDETIVVTLGAAPVGTLVGTNAAFTYTINDDDNERDIEFRNPCDYGFSKTITIDHTRVDDTGASDLTNYPLLISFTDPELATVANGGSVENSTGYDIAFTYLDSLVWLDHEIEKYNETTGEYIAWVKIPALDYNENTQITMHYGNPNIALNPSVSSVWSEYLGVWHLNGDVKDSSPNSHGGTDNGTNDAPGKVGNGRDFDGIGDFIELASFPNLQTDFSITAWVNTDNLDAGQRVFIDDDNNTNGYALSIGDPGSGRLRFYSRGTSPISVDGSASFAVSAGSWFYVTGIADINAGGSRTLYVNQNLAASTTHTNMFGVDVGSAAIGGETLSGETGNRFTGTMDEVRVYNGLLSASRVITEYNNYNNPATFYSIGAEVASASCEIAENSSEQLEITVSVNPIDNVSSTEITVSATAGTATNNSDYILAPTVVTIPAGSQSATFKFPLINDLIDEASETIELSLSGPSSNTKIGSNNDHVHTIIDEDGAPEIGFIDIVSVANEGSSLVPITLELALESGNDVSVDYTVTGGDAASGTDFIALSGTATIPAGNLTTTISFQPIDDAVIETPETVQITIANPVNGTLKPGFESHTVTIADNDDLGFEGPGGVGDVENALGENLLKLWLIADSVNFSGGNVTVWNNIIKNVSVDYDMVPAATAPKVVNTAINGHKEISFNNINDALISQAILSAASFPGNEMSFFIVTETDNLNQASYAYATDDSENGVIDANSVSASIPNGSGNAVFNMDGDSFSTPFLSGWTGTHSIFTHIVSSDTFLVYRNNNVLVNRDDANPSFTGHTGYNFYLGKNGAAEYFQGDIAEVIMFSRNVNIAQSYIINNYLAAKYNLTIVNDLYNFEVSHGVEVAGIGRYDEDNQHVAARAGVVTISNAADLDNGEYVLFGHDNADISSWNSNEVPTTGIFRTAREWRFTNTGSPGTISISIDSELLPALPTGQEDYIIMKDADGDFSSGSTVIYTVLVDGQYKASELSIASGDYVTFGIVTRSVSFSPIARSGSESVAANATITLSLESSGNITLNYNITGGTATGGSSDYSLAASGQVTFIAGQTSVNLALGIINDSQVESDETILITLSNPPSGVSIGNPVFTYTIHDDDNSRNVQFTTTSSSGNENVSAVLLQVDLNSADPGNNTRVNYAITGGTAEGSPAPDYTFTAGTLIIPASATTGTIDLTILNDVLSEATETIIVSLSNPVNANLGANVSHTYSIIDNDAPVNVEFQNPTTTIDEGGSIAEVVVELSSTSGQDITLDYAAAGVTAIGSGVDFALANGTLTIPAGSQLGTINIALTDDGIEESAETLTLTISNAAGAILGTQTSHSITITDNDAEFGFYGPGGVGDFNYNMLWLDATAVNGKGVANLNDGAAVSTWVDRSGNGYDFAAIGSAPRFDVDALNSKNTVIISSSNQGLQAPAGFSNALSNYSFFSVGSQSSGNYLAETNTPATSEFRLSQGANGLYAINDTDYLPSQSTSANVASWIFDAQNNPNARVFRNGAALLSDNNYEVMAIADNFAIGSRNSDNTQAVSDFAGNISEFIVYRNVVNDAQRVIIENYLANKYNLSIANDFYSYQGTYGFDIVGIGRQNNEQHLQSMSDSLLMISGASDLQNGEYLFVGHDNGDDLTWTASETPSGESNVRRLAREWRSDITGSPGTIILQIDIDRLPTPAPGYDQYVVYTDEDGDFRSGATKYQVEYSPVSGFYVSGEVVISDGTFITIGVGQPVIQFSLTESAGAESVTNPSIQVALNFSLGENATVNYAATGGSAVGGNVDYLLASGTLTVAAGQLTSGISLGVIDDAVLESDETIEITLTTPSTNVALGSGTVFTYTIHDNDNPENRTVEFATAGPGAGDEATPSVTPVVVNINTPDSDVVTTVDLQVISSGANAADQTDDFTLSTTTVSFPADNTTISRSFDLSVVDDAIFEGTEIVTIRLINPVNANLGAITEYTLNIADNDAQPMAGFSQAASSVSESGATTAFEVSLDQPSAYDVTINFTVASTATPDADYTLSNGSVVIQAGDLSEDIEALIVNDLLTEAAETVTVTLTTAINATVGGIVAHTLTILDDDQSGSTGPGGVGDASTNLLWLRGDSFVTGTWSDISGNDNHFMGAGPVAGGTGINSQPTVEFNGTQNLSIASSISDDISDYDFFFVADPDITSDQILMSSTGGIILGIENANGGFQDADATWKGDEIATGAGSASIVQYNLESGAGLAAISLNGVPDTPASPFDYTATSMSGASFLGALSGGGSGFDGEMGEIIIYNAPLNDAQTVIVNNYLSTRYDIGITDDYFAFDDGTVSNDYFYNLIGIGQEGSDVHVTATSDALLTISNPNNLQDGEYLMIADDNGAVSAWGVNLNVPNTVAYQRLGRQWRVDKTGDVGTVSFQVDVSDLPAEPSAGLTWALLVESADADFTNGGTTVFPLSLVSGSIFGFNGLSFADGDHFTIALVNYQSSGLSSDFNDPAAWITGVVPNEGSYARIVDGHDLFLTADAAVGSLALTGTGSLDLDGYTLEFAIGCINLEGSGTVDVSDAGSTIGYTNPNATEQCVTGMTYNDIFTEGPSGSTKYLTGNIIVQGSIDMQSNAGTEAIFDAREFGTTDDYDIEIQGDWISEITFLARTGSVTFSGSSAQSINTLGGETFNDLTINKTSGDVTLSSGVSTAGLLTLTSGKINLNAHDLNINSGSTVTGGGTISYIRADGVGVLRQAVSLSTQYTFPIGDSDEYSPFTFRLNTGTLGASASVTINLRDAKHTNIIEPTYITKYWSVQQEQISGLVNYDVSYRYQQSDVVGAEASLSARKFSSSGNAIGGTVNASNNLLSYNGHTSFSDHTGESDAVPLPIELVFFRVELQNGLAYLTWATAGEIDNDYFQIQKSIDGTHFEDIGVVEGNGNSSDVISYNFLDRKAICGLVFYRLKQVDFAGASDFSPVERVEHDCSSRETTFALYPNPVTTNTFTFEFIGTENQEYKIRLIDQNGRLHYRTAVIGVNGSVEISPEEKLPAGLYLLLIEHNHRLSVMKVLFR